MQDTEGCDPRVLLARGAEISEQKPLAAPTAGPDNMTWYSNLFLCDANAADNGRDVRKLAEDLTNYLVQEELASVCRYLPSERRRCNLPK